MRMVGGGKRVVGLTPTFSPECKTFCEFVLVFRYSLCILRLYS